MRGFGAPARRLADAFVVSAMEWATAPAEPDGETLQRCREALKAAAAERIARHHTLDGLESAVIPVAARHGLPL